MTLKDVMASDVTNVFLNTDEHAESVTRYSLGDTSNPDTLTVVWEEEDAEDDRQRGQELVRRAKLHVKTSDSPNVKDRWRKGSQNWETESVGPVEGDLTVVTVIRHEEEKRRPKATRAF